MSRRRDRMRSCSGFTLVELLISMLIFSILMALVIALFIQITYQAKDGIARTDSVQQARIGLSQIDRQVRSGNLILNPDDENPVDSGVAKNYSLRIFTQENGEYSCVQWRVVDTDGDGFSALEFREWDPGYPLVDEVTDWFAVANNIVGPESSTPDPSDSATWPPFWIDSNLPSGTEAQNIRITLRFKDPDARTDSKPISLSSVVTGRNTVFGYSTTTCSAVPAP